MPALVESSDLTQQTTESAPDKSAHPTAGFLGVALKVLAVCAAILLAQHMQSVLIPFVLAGLVFYALDPLVDRLETYHVPRTLGGGLAIALVVALMGGEHQSFSDRHRQGAECGAGD
jgi:hypothetical protein